MEKNNSRTGRTKRPTERFQSFLESSKSSSTKRSTNKGDNTMTDGDDDQNNLHISKKSRSRRVFSCSHCGFSCSTSLSSQDFIKSHHMKVEHKVCYDNGLIHCPNRSCKKVFLTETDMEKHCTMKGSNNPCLMSYRENRAISSFNMHHTSTQVNLPSKGNNTTATPTLDSFKMSSLQLGTLFHDRPATKMSNPKNIGNEGLSQFTSRSHNFNVLVQGEYISSSQIPIAYSEHYSSNTSIVHSEAQAEGQHITVFDHTNSPDEQSDDSVERLGDIEGEASVSVETLLNMRSALDFAARYNFFTREDKACLLLEDMLQKAGAPLYLYDHVMKWACDNKDVLPSRVPFKNRAALYRSLSTKVHGDVSDNMKPQEILKTLPSGRRCGITVFNLYAQIITLLSNKAINDWENYFFKPTADNPFHLETFTDWDTGFFDDIETSVWYKRTEAKVVTNADDELLIPICLFIDSTVLSLSGSLSLEPVMFSLMIHNRETRKNHEAWLPLGYIHDPTNIAGRKYSSTAEKYTDYHAMLSTVLQDLTEVVNSNIGLVWDFHNVPGKSCYIRKKLFFRVAFIIGDTKGHDVLCCRMGSHNFTPGLCRDCNMLTTNADNPTFPCTFVKQSELASMTEEELQEKSFFRVLNYAFDRLGFGASPYGINGATAIDIMHSILIGMMEYLNHTFTDQLTGTQSDKLSETVSFLATFCSRAIPSFPNCLRFKKGLRIKGVMTAKIKLARCFLMLLALKTSSFREFLKDQSGKLPSAVHKKIKIQRQNPCDGEEDEDVEEQEEDTDGNSSSATSTHSSDSDGNESLQNLSSEDEGSCEDDEDDSSYDPNDDFDSRDPIIFTDDVYDSWIELFENILLFYGWLRSDKLPCNLFKHGSLSIAKYCTQSFMKQYREVAYRFEGMGLKLTKFHQLRHWYFYISMYGVPTNFDSSFCESHHIYHTKRTGRRTQKRQDELARQTAQRVYEGSLLNMALRRTKVEESSNRKGNIRRRNGQHLGRGSRFTICFDYTTVDEYTRNCYLTGQQISVVDVFRRTPEASFSWSHKRNAGKNSFPDVIFKSMVKKLGWFNNGEGRLRISSIKGYTELRIQTASDKNQRGIIRAHPDYRNGLWLDWIDVSWAVGLHEDGQEETVVLPAQVIMILDFDDADYEPVPEHILTMLPILTRNVDEVKHKAKEGIHLLVHSADFNNVEEDEQLTFASRYSMEPFFQMIEVTNILGIAFVARDPPSNDEDIMDFCITYVKNPKLWGNAFVPRLCHGWEHPDDDELHLDEFDETYNPW